MRCMVALFAASLCDTHLSSPAPRLQNIRLVQRRAISCHHLHLLIPHRPRRVHHSSCGSHQMPSKDGSLTLPPASPSPATGRLYDHPANCCCMVCESIGPSTYESAGASEVNSRSKFAVSRASV